MLQTLPEDEIKELVKTSKQQALGKRTQSSIHDGAQKRR